MTTEIPDRPIPVPLAHRLRVLLTQQFQGFLFLVSVAGAVALWMSQPRHTVLSGQVEAVRVVVPASRDGVLESAGRPLQPFDPVQQGVTLIASIDVTEALLAMQELTAQREQLQAELESQRRRIRRENRDWEYQARAERRELERQALDQRRSQLAIRERVDQLTSDLVDLEGQRRSLAIKSRDNQTKRRQAELTVEGLVKELERTENLIQRQMAPAVERIRVEQELRLQRHSIQDATAFEKLFAEQQEEIRSQLLGVKARLTEATQAWLQQTAIPRLETFGEETTRRAAQPGDPQPFGITAGDHLAIGEDDAQAELEPYVRAIAVQDAKIRKLANQIASNQILAPASGTIAEVHQPPGTFVRSGDPILTIASGQRRWIVAYLDEQERGIIRQRDSVAIRKPGSSDFLATSTIAELGEHFETVPAHLRRNTNVVQWGIPIKVPIPEDVEVVPGQMVELVVR